MRQPEAPEGEDPLARVALEMQRYEAGASIANTGTGSRREGDGFEVLILRFWEEVVNVAIPKCTTAEQYVQGDRVWTRVTLGPRYLILPDRTRRRDLPLFDPPTGWLDDSFVCSEMVSRFPGVSEACERYAPVDGPFAGPQYTSMFDGMTTVFDGTAVLATDGVLVEKILYEYKTGKASRGTRLDGNAHERLSFQVMQYLEVATKFPRCSLVVVANGAFARYKNKYHVNFHVQADRLRAFSWFSMEHHSTKSEYIGHARDLLQWLEGQSASRRARRA